MALSEALADNEIISGDKLLPQRTGKVNVSICRLHEVSQQRSITAASG